MDHDHARTLRLAKTRRRPDYRAMAVQQQSIPGGLPVAIIDDFLDRDTHAALLAWTLTNEAAFAPTMVGKGRHDPHLRSSRWVRGPEFEPWRERLRALVTPVLPVLARGAGLEPFDPARIEVQLACHNHGDFYDAHIDTAIVNPESRHGSRMLSMVYYFHAEPLGFGGGRLRLHPVLAGGGGTLDIAPVQNRLVGFASWAPHEVLPVDCPSRRFADSRFTLNIWAHRTSDAPASGQS